MNPALAAQVFVTLLEKLPEERIRFWEKKYDMTETRIEPPTPPEPGPRIVRISSNAIVWR